MNYLLLFLSYLKYVRYLLGWEVGQICTYLCHIPDCCLWHWPACGHWMEQCGIFSAAGGVKTYISVTETCDVMFKLSPQYVIEMHTIWQKELLTVRTYIIDDEHLLVTFNEHYKSAAGTFSQWWYIIESHVKA